MNRLTSFALRRMRSMRFRMRVLRLLPSGGPLGISLLGATLLVQALVPLGLAIATGDLVSKLPAAIGSRWGSAAYSAALRTLMVLAGLFLLSRVIGPVSSVVHAYLTRRINASVQARIMRAASRPVGISHLEDPDVLDDLEHIGDPVGEVVISVPILMAATVTALGAIGIVGSVDWRIGVVLFILVFAQRTFWRDFFLRMSDVRAAMRRDLRRASYLADLVLTPPAAKEVRIFGLTDWIRDAYREAWRRAVAPMWSLDDRNLRGLGAFLPFRAASFAIPFVSLVLQVSAGKISLGAFTAALQATSVAMSTARFRSEDVYLEQMAAPVHALYSVEGLSAAEPGSDEDASRQRVVVAAPTREIQFLDVSFTYPGSSIPVYEGLSLTIPAGKSTAIVGPNGAGKTTLVRLLARLHEPSSGSILSDGRDLSEADPEAWRRQLAIIFQDFVRYQLSASDNVTFGAPGIPIEPARTIASSKAGASPLIAALPHGWDTTLSRQFEKGTDLSGGQWQRIALARAFYAVEGGARVLVLDEPTSNLDVRAEAELFEDFMEMTRGLTTILISHRFSTVRRAEHICVIDQGRLMEEGDHDALMRQGGIYARMFSIQAARFK